LIAVRFNELKNGSHGLLAVNWVMDVRQQNMQLGLGQLVVFLGLER